MSEAGKSIEFHRQSKKAAVAFRQLERRAREACTHEGGTEVYRWNHVEPAFKDFCHEFTQMDKLKEHAPSECAALEWLCCLPIVREMYSRLRNNPTSLLIRPDKRTLSPFELFFGKCDAIVLGVLKQADDAIHTAEDPFSETDDYESTTTPIEHRNSSPGEADSRNNIGGNEHTGGRNLPRQTHENRKLVASRWQEYSDFCKSEGKRAFYNAEAATWMLDKFDDLGFLTEGLDPLDFDIIANRIKGCVNAYKDTPNPKNLVD